MMRAVKILLWIQLLLGLAGVYVAFAYMHWGAMSSAWAYNLRVDFDKMKQSPVYQEPAKIRDQSLDKILEDFQAYGRARADVAGYWLLTCGALVAFAVSMLWLLRRPAVSNPALQATAAPPRS